MRGKGVPSLAIIDLCINQRDKEDQTYLSSQQILRNLRQGNTFIQIAQNDLVWARKGFLKFFPLQLQYVKFNLGQKDHLTETEKYTKNEQMIIQENLFGEAKRLLEKGETVVVLKTR